ncbi:MAG: SufD family Fe-S cluster assembly protein [Prevotellaceae bacterium]|jgi:Fe-S cluster assembly protein SufD|nr:SufD family Fe-S cluster assembly protein [Prevotellaceae bacterium]
MIREDITKHIQSNTLRVGAGQSLAIMPEGAIPQDLQIEVQPRAQLDLLALHTGTCSVRFCVSQAEDSRVNLFLLALDGDEVAQSVRVNLLGAHAECSIFGLSAASLSQKYSSDIVVNHAAASCSSVQLFRQVVSDSAAVSFEGRVVVAQNAQHTDAHQSCKTLMLSESAHVHTLPHLEIYADDVKCSHGATVGQLSAEALFYLRSRGVSLLRARQLLLLGFADEVVQKIPAPAIRESIAALIAQKIAANAPADVNPFAP